MTQFNPLPFVQRNQQALGTGGGPPAGIPGVPAEGTGPNSQIVDLLLLPANGSADATVAVGAGSATADGSAAVVLVTVPASTGSATAGGSTVVALVTAPVGAGSATAAGTATAAMVAAAPGAGSGTGAGTAVPPSVVVPVGPGGATADGTVVVPTSGGVTDATAAVGPGSAVAAGSVVTPVVVAPPPDTGPTGGRYEPGGDETSILGESRRVPIAPGSAFASGGPVRVWTVDGLPSFRLPPRRAPGVTVRLVPAAARAEGGLVVSRVAFRVSSGGAVASAPGRNPLARVESEPFEVREDELAILLLLSG